MEQETSDLDATSPTEVVDVLWKQLLVAREAGDAERVRRIENRMRELQGERRFAHLSDEELDERIDALTGERAPRDVLGYSPGGGGGGGELGAEDTRKFNEQIRGNQHAGIEATLNALVDERERRRA